MIDTKKVNPIPRKPKDANHALHVHMAPHFKQNSVTRNSVTKTCQDTLAGEFTDNSRLERT